MHSPPRQRITCPRRNLKLLQLCPHRAFLPRPGPNCLSARIPQPFLGTSSPECVVDETMGCGNYDLDYEGYREDVPYRVYEYRRIPPLLNRVPVKIRRTHVGVGVKSSFSPHKVPRNSQLPPGQIKLRTKELYSIRGELSQIKAQVDCLLESLERMHQQREQHPGTEDSEDNRSPDSKGSSCRPTEPQQEPRGQSAHPEADSPKESTDPEEAVKNHASDQVGQ
ncbi:RNA-binding Raly-like protein isoform X1 [Equus przewalskii]|uniref:RNA-binding Raly-like protein isoform X1 n=1 Tax=Equus przewalskii TaxID=9798 RepID=A0ABM4NYF5_EQUPR